MAAATVVDAPYWPKDFRPPTVSYTPSMWDDTFTSFTLDHQVQEKYAETIEALKQEARVMLMAERNTISEKLVMIDTFERLGVAYHFEQEIEELLEEFLKFDSEEDDSLFTVALRFRLLRQHRHHASCRVFDKFKGIDNKFKETLKSDAKGLLSMYEATHLRIHGEQILEEALVFTTNHLKHMVQQLHSLLQDQVKRALEQPRHRGNPRVESRYYISFYEKDNSKNELLLKLAKLDFNYMQNIYKKEICELSRWWNELDLKSKMPYARDRVIESYFWGVTSQFKPQYSYVRVAIAKSIQILTNLDDTYDNYATRDEADLFTEIIQRWNIDEIHQLPEDPDYMKILYRFFLTVYEDYERDAAKQGKLFAVPYAKQTVKEICKSYSKGLKWFMGEKIMPSFEDYTENAIITSCIYTICSIPIPGMKSVTKETIDWMMSEPKIFKASAKVCRYLDDLGSFERESKQGKILTGVDFYMKQHCLPMQETKNKFIELTEDAWKDLNTEWMTNKTASTPNDMMELVLGFARASEIFFRSFQDGFTKAQVVAPYVAALLVDPIIM